MSTKFSSGKGTQTTPKICHPAPIIIPPGPFPPHCDIRYGTNWYGTDLEDNPFEYFHQFILKWKPAFNFWFGKITAPPVLVYCQVTPDEPNNNTDIQAINGLVMHFNHATNWKGPPYVEGQPWTPPGHSRAYSGAYTIHTTHNFTM